MVRDDAITLLLSRLGNRDPATWQTTIINEMVLTQETRLEGDSTLRMWFLVTENSQNVCTIGDSRIAQPTDFLDEVEDSALEVYDSVAAKWITLKKDDWGFILEEFKDSDPAIPQKYAVLGNYFRVQPTPNLAYPVRMVYYQRAQSLATNIENAWLKWAADLVIAETGLVMATQHIKDPELVASFQMQSTEARRRLKVANEARMHSNRTYEMGED